MSYSEKQQLFATINKTSKSLEEAYNMLSFKEKALRSQSVFVFQCEAFAAFESKNKKRKKDEISEQEDCRKVLYDIIETQEVAISVLKTKIATLESDLKKLIETI